MPKIVKTVVLMAAVGLCGCASMPPMNAALMPKKLYFAPVAYNKNVSVADQKIFKAY